MRIVDLTEEVQSAIETLQEALSNPGSLQNSCYDLTPEELLAYISKLCQLSRLASTVAELAADTLSEETQ